jgi:hypothetical protein
VQDKLRHSGLASSCQDFSFGLAQRGETGSHSVGPVPCICLLAELGKFSTARDLWLYKGLRIRTGIQSFSFTCSENLNRYLDSNNLDVGFVERKGRLVDSHNKMSGHDRCSLA